MFRYQQTDPKTGITYVFEQESHWVPELKQSRATRRIVGKINKETGEIEPTRKRRPSGKLEQADTITLRQWKDELEKRQKTIDDLQGVIQELRKEVQALKETQKKKDRKLSKLIRDLQNL